MATLKSLAAKLRRHADAIPKNVDRVTKAVATQVAVSLIDDTPVDTSKALSNWQVGVGGPVSGSIEAYVPGKFGSTVGASSAAAKAAAMSAIESRKPGQAIHIVNNVDYIKELNQGSSRQAPAGFVEAAVLRAKTLVKEMKVLK